MATRFTVVDRQVRRPRGVATLAVVLGLYGGAMTFVSSMMAFFLVSPLFWILAAWGFETATAQALGRIALFLTLGLVTLTMGIGLWRGRSWSAWAVLAGLTAHGAYSLAIIVIRTDAPGRAVGAALLAATAGLVAYMLRSDVKAWFAQHAPST